MICIPTELLRKLELNQLLYCRAGRQIITNFLGVIVYSKGVQEDSNCFLYTIYLIDLITLQVITEEWNYLSNSNIKRIIFHYEIKLRCSKKIGTYTHYYNKYIYLDTFIPKGLNIKLSIYLNELGRLSRLQYAYINYNSYFRLNPELEDTHACLLRDIEDSIEEGYIRKEGHPLYNA